jgi:hypothetical protein
MFIEDCASGPPVTAGSPDLLAGGLFLVHAAIQAQLFLRQQRAAQPSPAAQAGQAMPVEEPAPLAAPPPVVGAEHPPWRIKPGEQALGSTDADNAQRDNTKDD